MKKPIRIVAALSLFALATGCPGDSEDTTPDATETVEDAADDGADKADDATKDE